MLPDPGYGARLVTGSAGSNARVNTRGLLGRRLRMQIPAGRRELAVAHRGLDGHEVDAGSRQQRAVGVPEVVESPRTKDSRVPRALEPTAERRAIESAPKRVLRRGREPMKSWRWLRRSSAPAA